MKRTKPTIKDLHLAAEWLSIYEGSDEECDSCERVRQMLVAKADDLMFKETCKASGLKPSYVLKKLRELK